MRKFWTDPDVQIRTVEWGFGAIVAILIVLALMFGWVGGILDGVSSWYTANIVPDGVAQPVPVPLNQAYVPGTQGELP